MAWEHLRNRSAKALGGRRKEAVITTSLASATPTRPIIARPTASASWLRSTRAWISRSTTPPCRYALQHGALPDVENAAGRDHDRALDEGGEGGKARAIGISNFTLAQIKEVSRTRRVDVGGMQYCCRICSTGACRQETFRHCRENGIGVMAYGLFAYGMLSGTFSAEISFDESDWRSKRGRLGGINLFQHLFGPEQFVRNIHAVEELKAVAKRYGKICRNSRCAGPRPIR